MNVVLDANVVAGGVCWDGDPYLILVKLARRRFTAVGTMETIEETRETCQRLIRSKKPKHNAAGRLTWYCGSAVRLVEPAPLGKPRSRDKKDDPYLAAAVGAKAEFIVTYDKDLLDLGKPFGVEILKPIAFLKRLED